MSHQSKPIQHNEIETQPLVTESSNIYQKYFLLGATELELEATPTKQISGRGKQRGLPD